MDKPKLRYIEAIPIEEDGERRILIRDPQNMTDKMLALAPEAFMIVAMFDGENSIVDVQAEIAKRFGQIVPRETIESMLEVLDENLLLESDRFRTHQKKMFEEFRSLAVREPTCAGGAYAADPVELRQEIESYFDTQDGPGSHNGEATKPVKALISPHIDYVRGGHCYAHVYQKLNHAPPVDVFIILGTGHAGPRGHYVFTKKDFETPLGVVETDREFIQALEEKIGNDLCEEEFIHKGEHSVELQLTFIQLTYEETQCPKIVPILCGGFHEAIKDGKVPAEVPEVKRFLDALKETIAESEKRVCVLASADLAHVGPRFGDEKPVDGNFLRWLESEDLEMLEVVQDLKAEDFFRNVQKDMDRRRVCGLASIYTLLSVTDAEEVELLKYSQAADPSGEQCVTFCGMTFH